MLSTTPQILYDNSIFFKVILKYISLTLMLNKSRLWFLNFLVQFFYLWECPDLWDLLHELLIHKNIWKSPFNIRFQKKEYLLSWGSEMILSCHKLLLRESSTVNSFHVNKQYFWSFWMCALEWACSFDVLE